MSVLDDLGLAMLRRLDPERAHGLALRALASGLVRASHTNFVLRRTKPTSPWPIL